MKKFTHNLKSNSGFSTLEMLIAMSILIMVLSTIIFVTFGDQSISIDSQKGSEALTKAEGLLKKEQALSREDFKMVNPLSPFPDPVDGTYKDSISVTNVDYFTKQITSLVTYAGDRNKTESVSLTSLVTNFENAQGGDTCYSNLGSAMGDWTKPKILNAGHSDLATILADAGGSYPVTDLDAYQGKLYVSVNGSSITSPATNPTTGADSIGAGPGTVSWANAGNIQTGSDSQFATAIISSGNITHYLQASGFGFNLPEGATILGIQVDIQRKGSSSTNTIKDNEVRLVKADNSLSVANKAVASAWGTSESYGSYGNSGDLWNETGLSVADINSPNFGAVLSATSASGLASRTASVDNIRVTVTYIKSFEILSVSNPSVPTFSTALSSSPIPAGVNAVATDGVYAYLATNSAQGQLQIANITTTPPTIVSTLKLGSAGTSVGSSIFYSAGYVYLGLTNTSSGPKEFNIVDVHDPANPVLAGSASIGNTVNGIYVLNNYAYVASPNANDLLVYDVSASKLSNAMTPVGSYNGDGGLHGKSIFVVGTTAYLGRTFGTNELYALNAGTISSISDLGHKDIGTGSGTSINSLIVRDYLAFLLDTAGQFEVWRVDVPSAMTRYDTTPLGAFPSNTNNTPLDCEGNIIYGAYTDSSNKGNIEVITSS